MLPQIGSCATQTHADSSEHLQMAQNINTDPTLLAVLAEDTDSSVRLATATNPATLSFVLRKLAFDPNFMVRQAALTNPSLGN